VPLKTDHLNDEDEGPAMKVQKSSAKMSLSSFLPKPKNEALGGGRTGGFGGGGGGRD